MQLVLRRNLSEPTFALAIAMRGVPANPTVTPSVSADIHWRWADDDTMEPQFLGSVVAGHELRVPFDLKGRAIRLYAVSKQADGFAVQRNFNDAEQVVFAVGVAALSNLTFSAPDVTGDIENNSGTGDISILRKLSTDTEFSVIQTVSAATTSFTDTPVVNGDYEYKLTQAGLEGESNTLSVTVTGGGGGAGTPPDTLDATFDGVETVTVTWVNHGGTGDNIIEAKIGSGGTWTQIGSVASGTATFDDTEPPSFTTYVVYYRVYNDAVTGYSNEDHVTIPREF